MRTSSTTSNLCGTLFIRGGLSILLPPPRFRHRRYLREHDIKRSREREFILAVQYTRNCMITSQAELTGYYAKKYPHFEKFSLGHNASRDKEDYWKSVEEAIQRPARNSFLPLGISKVVAQGESSEDPGFKEVLEIAVSGNACDSPPIYKNDTVFIVAKGAAELERQALARGDGTTIPDKP